MEAALGLFFLCCSLMCSGEVCQDRSSNCTSVTSECDTDRVQMADLCPVTCYLCGPCPTVHCPAGQKCVSTSTHTSAPYSCVCPDGFTGSNCTDSPCAGGEKCQNGGTCRVNNTDINDYSCSCLVSFTGSACEDCACQNGGVCDSLACNCTGTGFMGDTCAVEACPHTETIVGSSYHEVLVPAIAKRTSIAFSVKSCQDVHLALGQTPDLPHADNMVEIGIGTSAGTWQRIGSCWGTCSLGGKWGEGLVSCDEYRSFWVSWNMTSVANQSQVSLGLGDVVGENVFMTVNTTKVLVVNHAAIASYGTTVAEWSFDFPEPNPEACPTFVSTTPEMTTREQVTETTLTTDALSTATTQTDALSTATTQTDALSTGTTTMTTVTSETLSLTTPTTTSSATVAPTTGGAASTQATTNAGTSTFTTTDSVFSSSTDPPSTTHPSSNSVPSSTTIPSNTTTYAGTSTFTTTDSVFSSSTDPPSTTHPSSNSVPSSTTIPSNSVSSSTTLPRPSLCYLECRCVKATNATQPVQDKALQELITDIKKNLTLEAETSAQRRSRTSAPDYRPSSQAIGAFGVILLAVVFGLIALSDLISLWAWLAKTKSTRGASEGGERVIDRQDESQGVMQNTD